MLRLNISLQSNEDKKKLKDGVFSLRSCLLDLERSLPLLEVVNHVVKVNPDKEYVLVR